MKSLIYMNQKIITGIKKGKNSKIGRETPASHSMYDFNNLIKI